MAFNSFSAMLGLEVLDFSNMNMIFHLNSIARVYGSFETTDSRTRDMSTLESG
jgi:hypothetical protein